MNNADMERIRRNIEHRELTQAITAYNNKTANSTEMQKQLWALWRFNCNVCVPTYPDQRPPYDWAMMPTNIGNAYAFYTESKLVCEGDKPFIIHVPFRELLNRMYSSNGLVTGLFANPTINNRMASYSIGFSKELLEQLCKGDILAY